MVFSVAFGGCTAEAFWAEQESTRQNAGPRRRPQIERTITTADSHAQTRSTNLGIVAEKIWGLQACFVTEHGGVAKLLLGVLPRVVWWLSLCDGKEETIVPRDETRCQAKPGMITVPLRVG
jgi:hypothetical protein